MSNPRILKMVINADLVVVGDRMVHPRTRRTHTVKSIQRSYGHMDYLDFGFDDEPMLQVWRTSSVTVER